MKVLQSEKNRILKSTSYDLFNYSNYKIQVSRVNMLMVDIERKNLNKDIPIIIDDEYNILKGRHVFLALKNLGYPIYYKVAEVGERLDFMMAKKYNKSCSPFDFAVFHKDKFSYRYLLDFNKETKISFKNIYSQIFFLSKNIRSNDYRIFQEGNWVLSTEDKSQLDKKLDIIKYFESLGFSSTDTYSYVLDEPINLIKNIFNKMYKYVKYQIEYVSSDISGCNIIVEIYDYFYDKKLYYNENSRMGTNLKTDLIKCLRAAGEFKELKQGIEGVNIESYRIASDKVLANIDYGFRTELDYEKIFNYRLLNEIIIETKEFVD